MECIRDHAEAPGCDFASSLCKALIVGKASDLLTSEDYDFDPSVAQLRAPDASLGRPFKKPNPSRSLSLNVNCARSSETIVVAERQTHLVGHLDTSCSTMTLHAACGVYCVAPYIKNELCFPNYTSSNRPGVQPNTNRDLSSIRSTGIYLASSSISMAACAALVRCPAATSGIPAAAM